MTRVKTKYNRRDFIKSSAIAGGGLMLSFSWLASCKPEKIDILEMPDEWFELNGFLKVGNNGVVSIMSPNPEIGQNVKTSMPMIVAEELDVDWANVLVEQAPLNTDIFSRQLAGGSQSIRQGWDSLRMVGATARQMLKQAAADLWEVPLAEITTSNGVVMHEASGKKAGYGELANAASQLDVPEEVELKEVKDFKIIGHSQKNVDGPDIVMGKPLFGLDVYREGMLVAMLIHPPAFGMRIKDLNANSAKSMPGIKDVYVMNAYPEDYIKQWSDITAFNEMVVIVGETTWQVMQAKKAVRVTWEEQGEFVDYFESGSSPDGKYPVTYPGALESTAAHKKDLASFGEKLAEEVRKDGDPEAAFRNADQIIERSYSAPFLAHNCMEPMNFFADVQDDYAELVGPIQTPEYMEKSASARLGLPLEKIDIKMTRMGGGFGRRLYGHFLVEAAAISQKMKSPVKLVYSREDDMTFGTYRPAYYATYRAALDENKQLIGFHVRAGGIPSGPLFANRFPAGAIDNYLAESWSVDSNVTTGAFRAPRSNFIAGAEQSFLDELAEAMGKDPFDLRLELLDRAKTDPVGKPEENDYDPERYAGVLQLAREKSGWDKPENSDKSRGVSAYYCHNSYVANVLDLVLEDGQARVDRVCCAVDCGIVVNPDAAVNMVEGGTVDGIGHAMYSGLSFREGKPDQKNFDTYRLIRHAEAPKSIDVHFVESEIKPTGLGEPPFPPIMGALANALYRLYGKRVYHQPFVSDGQILG